MFRTLFVRAVAAYAVVAGMAQFAPAAIITSFSLPSGPIIPVSTPAPNNNNSVTASPNVIDLPVAPGTALVFNNLNPIDFVFSVQHSSGVTEYFLRETILNNSGMDWSGFRVMLTPSVTVVGGTLPATFESPSPDPIPTASAFSVLMGPQLGGLTWSNGLVPSGGTLELSFTIDTEDSAPQFTLTQAPVNVPEPAALALFAVAAAILLAYRPFSSRIRRWALKQDWSNF